MGIPSGASPGHLRRSAISDDGVAIAYGDFGPRNARTIVLCHGLGATGELFAADAAYFAGRGYRVLLPDLRGHGASGKPAGHLQDGFTIECMAAD